MPLFDLTGKVAIVSGGAGIVGKHIVRGLSDAGATVVSASRATGVDFSKQSQLVRLRNETLAAHGRIDVLVNNAVARAGTDFDDCTPDQWASSMELNSTGLLLACQVFSEPMRARRSGSIINIASIYGLVGPTLHIYEGTRIRSNAAYAFAKGGMVNFTRYLAGFLGPENIRVNCLCPGGFQTEQHQPEFVANYSRQTPLRRMAQGDDIVGPVVFLASDASAYITGQNIAVDGGWTAI